MLVTVLTYGKDTLPHIWPKEFFNITRRKIDILILVKFGNMLKIAELYYLKS